MVRLQRRMASAVAPYATQTFITPMAAVAGAVAEEILAAMTSAATLDRAYVNDGGDIALHLGPGAAIHRSGWWSGRIGHRCLALQLARQRNRCAASPPVDGEDEASRWASPTLSRCSPTVRPWRMRPRPSLQTRSTCPDIPDPAHAGLRTSPESDLGDRLVTQESGI